MIKKLIQQAGTIGAGVAIVVVVLAFLFGFNRVDEYEVGVRRNPVTGAVSSTPYPTGPVPLDSPVMDQLLDSGDPVPEGRCG